MKGSEVSSSDGSTAIGGDNQAPIVNVNAGDGSIVSVKVEQLVTRELPSFLAAVIALFSKESLSQYGLGPRRALPPEIIEKIKFNDLPQDHRVLVDYRRHGQILEKAYHGVEQQNADARYLVRRKTRVAYEQQLTIASASASIPVAQKEAFAIKSATSLLDAVIGQLLKDYICSTAVLVEQETAHLAVSLIVADAVVECEVLERPHDVITP